jgi:hypothetical protein
MLHRRIFFLLMGITIAGIFTCADAQWPDYPDSRIPRTKDGKPNLTAPAPRLNGRPDLSGVWQADRSPASEYDRVLGKGWSDLQPDTQDITTNFLNLFWGMKPEEEPLRPEAAAMVSHRRQNPQESPFTQCLPGGIPATLLVQTFKIVQTPREVVMLPEIVNPPRQIYMDGRPLPKDPDPRYMGYSVGRWEGDTLVIDTVGVNVRAPLDIAGHPRSESMRITERYRRRDVGHMDLEITFNDPIYYTRPFSIKTGLTLLPGTDLFEYVCAENEKDRVHLGK